MQLTAFHHVLLAQGASVPDWIHLVPAGTFRGVDGRGPWRLRDAQAVINASIPPDSNVKLPIDENHAIDVATKAGLPSPARGWIVELQAREDGIYGRVEWNDSGVQLMSDRAYGGISPVFTASKVDGTVLRILRAALTNTPNLTQLDTLNSQQETGMDLASVRKALGLPETADEAACLAAIAANATATSTHSQVLGRIAQAAGLDAAAAPDAVVTALQTRQQAGDPKALADQVVSLQTQLTTLQQDTRKKDATAFVDGAIKAGKPIAPLRDHYITRHMADATAVEKEIGALVSINAGGVAVVLNAKGEPDGDEATPAEKQVAAKMGIDPKKMVEHRKKREGAAGNGGAA